MLGSITPLGERSRRMRWGITATAYGSGSVAGGAAIGALLGLAGSPLTARLAADRLLGLLAAAACVAVAFDLRLGGLRLPTLRRQVDGSWMRRYRGWVYGAGFGVQLGLGVVTIVTTAAVYLAGLAALLSGGAVAGALIGAVFGAARASTILLARGADSPGAVIALDGTMQRLRRRAGMAAVAGTGLAAVLAVAAVVL